MYVMTKWVNEYMDSVKCQALLLAIQYGSLTAAGKELGIEVIDEAEMLRLLGS